MKKIFLQGAIIVLLFLSALFCLRQVNWMSVFKIQQFSENTEHELGDVLLDVILKTEKEIGNHQVTNAVDSIVSRICESNNIDKDQIKIHVIDKDDINAFAMPNGHLIVYSGLIANSDNQDELAGVLSHEIAHIQLNHVTKKLLSELGVSAVVTLTSGKGSTVILKEALKKLSTLTYSRGLEKEADLKGVEYMVNAQMDPTALAHFLMKQASDENESAKYLQWVSTHPDSRDRSIYIIEYIGNKTVNKKAVLSDSTWNKLKENSN